MVLMTPGLSVMPSITSSLHHSPLSPDTYLTHSVPDHYTLCQAVRKQSFGGYWVAKKLICTG